MVSPAGTNPHSGSGSNSGCMVLHRAVNTFGYAVFLFIWLSFFTTGRSLLHRPRLVSRKRFRCGGVASAAATVPSPAQHVEPQNPHFVHNVRS